MKKKKPSRWLDRELLRCPVHYTLCTDEKDFYKVIGKMGMRERDTGREVFKENGALTHVFTKTDGLVSCIVTLKVRKGYSTLQDYALLTHEAMHIWDEIRKFIGEDKPSPEFEAYSVQTIVQNLFYEYNRQLGIPLQFAKR